MRYFFEFSFGGVALYTRFFIPPYIYDIPEMFYHLYQNVRSEFWCLRLPCSLYENPCTTTSWSALLDDGSEGMYRERGWVRKLDIRFAARKSGEC